MLGFVPHPNLRRILAQSQDRGNEKKNQLGIADDARLRDEAVVLVVGADLAKEAEVEVEVEKEIKQLRASGEIDAIIESMRLELSHWQGR